MFVAQVNRETSAPATSAWRLLADWGNTSWIPGPERTEVVTSGGRVMRRLFMPGVSPIEETLHVCDQDNMRLEYTIAVSELFTLADYRGEIAVVPTADGCRVEWRCSFDQGAMSDEEAGAVANGNLNFLLDSLAAFLEKS